MAQPITITLTVDIDKLFSGKGRASRNEVVRACTLSDNNNGRPLGSGCLFFLFPTKKVTNFTTYVGPNTNITWEGKSSDPSYTVIIDSIVYRYDRNSFNFFDSIILKPATAGINHVTKQLRAGITHDEYQYFINFRIEHLNHSHDFQIDPRLKMQTAIQAGER